MKFYQEFSKYYDDIFPLKEGKLNFLTDQLESKGNVLDVATGTGNYALALAEKNYQVTGIDLSEKMIKIAREKAAERGVMADFKVEDMRNIKDLFTPRMFDLIYCIGNSLVHLENASEITEVLKQFYNLLADNGKLVIQIVNYNRILANNITGLPSIENREKRVKLIRNYELKEDENKVVFKTALHTPEGKYSNSVLLYPLTAEELKSALNKASFSRFSFYGGFNYEDFSSQESFPLVVIASK